MRQMEDLQIGGECIACAGQNSVANLGSSARIGPDESEHEGRKNRQGKGGRPKKAAVPFYEGDFQCLLLMQM